MVTLRKIAAHRASTYAIYLTEPDATEEATGPDGDALATPGWWLGSLADEWGIARMAVDHAALCAVLDGRDPRTGERVVRVWRDRPRVAGHDLVFSAPSSVTAAWALAGEELRVAIQRAQDAAVGEAFGYIEREFALVRRRQDGAIISEPAAALLGAAFSHHTSRQTVAQARAGVPPDPQLHTHVLLPGLARRRDGAFVAVDSLELHRRRAEAGAVYRAALAGRLVEIGFHVKRATGNGDRYFELVGIPAELRQTWSSRSQEIVGAAVSRRQEFRAARGRDPTLTEEREWAAKSRTSKARFQHGDLFRFWADTAAHLGVTRETVEALPETAAVQLGSYSMSVINRHFDIMAVLTSHLHRIAAGCRLVLAIWVHPPQEAGEPVTGHSYQLPEYRRATLGVELGTAPRPESVEALARP